MKLLKILLCLTCLIVVVSAGFNIYLYRQVIRLSQNSAPVAASQEEFTDTPESVIFQDKNADESYIRELEYQLSATEEELDMISEQLAEELDNKNPQKNMLSNAVFSKTMMSSIDRDYTLIYGPMDLSPEDLQKFKDIVAAWRIANANRNAIRLAASTPEEREAVEKLGKETREKYEGEFIELMGEEKFKIYDDFKNSSSEVYILNTYMNTLSPEDKIGDADAYSLINSMYIGRKAIENEMFSEGDNDSSGEKRYDYRLSLEKNVMFYRKYEEIIDDASLPPAQTAQLKAYLRKDREKYESQLRYLQDSEQNKIVKQ